MSVFEDLIGELKNENLLEETVIDLGVADAAAPKSSGVGEMSPESENFGLSHSSRAPAGDEFLIEEVAPAARVSDNSQFFRKRATEEVSSLQMVEHLFSGVEREHMKVPSVAYDDLNAKKALHKFLQVSEEVNSQSHAEAEFALRNETEAWNLALYERDQKISVANVRRFCEGSRPVLSSQALIALARFYRNSPFSEEVRGKFDYVMTRLFSRESDFETRQLLFGRDEMIGHINTLYANWSSIAIYTKDDDHAEVSLTVARFDEFTKEATDAKSFDELLGSDFFNRVRAYKEESAEMFFVPDVTAAAMTCNLAIGNRYVELIARERAKIGQEKVEEKYGAAHDQAVTEAAGKTLLLSDVVTVEMDDFASPDGEPEKESLAAVSVLKPANTSSKSRPGKKESKAPGFTGVNKWLVAICLIFVLAGVGIYIWAENFAGGESSGTTFAQPVAVDDPEIAKYVQHPRSTAETFYAVVTPSFENLSEDEQRTLLGKIVGVASSKNLSKVSLINKKGRTVAFATKDRIDLIKE